MCNGADSGCYNIAEGDGDCDSDADCQPGLSCGENNCVRAQFDSDDCCFRRSEDDRYDAPPQYGGSAATGRLPRRRNRSTTRAEPRRGVLGGVRPQGRRVPASAARWARAAGKATTRTADTRTARMMLEQSLLHRRVPSPPSAPPSPPSRSAAAAEMPALDFGACAAELRPSPFVPRADLAALEGKLELGQTHVVDVRELGLPDGEEAPAARPSARPRAPTAPTSAPNRTSASTPPSAPGLLSGPREADVGSRDAPPLHAGGAHLRGGDARARQRDDGGRRRARHARAAAAVGAAPSSSRSSRRTTSTSTEGWASGSPRGGR